MATAEPVESNAQALEPVLPATLDSLAETIESKGHLLAGNGDAHFASVALQAAKDLFDLGLNNEHRSHPHLHPFLVSILEPPAVATRSKTKAKKVPSPEADRPKVDPVSVLPYTPLSELTTAGLDPEQIWAQLELRAEPVVTVLKGVGSGQGDDADEDGSEGVEEKFEYEDEEGGSDEEMTVEEWKRMMAEDGVDEDVDSDEESGSGEDEDDESDEDESIKWKDETESESDEGDEDEDLEDLDVEGSDEEGDDEDDEEEDEYEDLGVDEDEDEDEDEDGSDDAAQEGDAAALFGSEPGPSRRKRHPTLDDDFFSIDEFNRMTEEAEAGKLSGGRLGGDEDEEDEDDLGDAGALMLQGAPDDDEDIMYSDFFSAPRGVATKGNSVKGKGKEKSKKGGKKSKEVSFEDEDEEMEEAELEDEEDEEDDGRDTMGRFKGDLFDSDDEEEAGEKTLSTHEKQQRALAQQIAQLESEAIGPKDWTLLGEASSRTRPENSLLEEDLDFEQVQKVVPTVTESFVASLEELIKKRIIENNFDSPVRVRAYEPTPYLASKYFDLQDTQSAKSLAQIYEDEYQAGVAGGKAVDPRDEKLKKEHDEVDRLWNDICYKLDALSSLNFVPKQPKAQITTVDNLPTASMESALPPTSSAATMLAPEELFAPPTARNLVARSEQTPEEAHAARGKRRREKKAERKKLGDMAELYGKKGGAKAEKERALNELVKTGKGVTVIGKGDKERGKAAKRAAGGEEAKSDSKRLKL